MRDALLQYLQTERSITTGQPAYIRQCDGALVTRHLPLIEVQILPPLYVQMSAAYTTEEV